MSEKKIIDLGSKKIDLNDNDIPIALNYFGRLEVRDWEELFFVAVKCLYTEFPDVVSNLCSKDSSQNLFLRTTTIDMKKPRRIAPIIFLETKRTPLQIVQAIRKIFLQAGVLNINMKIEVAPPPKFKADLEKIYSPPTSPVEIKSEKILPPQKKVSKIKLPKISLDQSIEEMLAALDGVKLPQEKKSSPPPTIKKNSVGSKDLEVPLFGKLFFTIRGERYGPFANEKMRYVELMKCLAENFPTQMRKHAGRHVNSKHRITLVHGDNYLYFREPVMLPNDLFADKGFSDAELRENAKYYLENCGLSFETVMFP